MANYWLMKSEPDLRRDGSTLWSGVRNYQARNYMTEMRTGDRFLFYHSNAEPSGVVGTGQVLRAGVTDPTQFDKKSEYFDARSTPAQPRWTCAEVRFETIFPKFIPLEELRRHKVLANMPLLQKGTRLSVHPVSAAEFNYILKLGGA